LLTLSGFRFWSLEWAKPNWRADLLGGQSSLLGGRPLISATVNATPPAINPRALAQNQQRLLETRDGSSSNRTLRVTAARSTIG